MPKFAVGDTVEKVAGKDGVVVGIFTTTDGEPRYAIKSEGTLDFVVETKLVPSKTQH